ncbi:hypothetical protein V6N13_024705 [Hibiscus sabdariffa]
MVMGAWVIHERGFVLSVMGLSSEGRLRIWLRWLRVKVKLESRLTAGGFVNGGCSLMRIEQGLTSGGLDGVLIGF